MIPTLLIVGILSVSCSDYLDVDTDTDNPKTAPLDFLLSSTQIQLSRIGDFNVNGGSQLSTYTHQMTSREEDDQYGIKVDNISMTNDWNDIYLNINDLKTIISQGTASGNMVYVGIAQVEIAYSMSIAVDMWGDVPYADATNLVGGNATPKFDDQAAIYKAIFALIDLGKTNINSNLGTLKPGTDDLYYAGNRTKWVKFANTLKLKLYNQTNLTTDFDQTGFNALVAENNFMSSSADDFQFNHYVAISPSNERNRLFRESYESTQFGSYQSPWLYEVLKGMNPKIHTGNPDPRTPYYIYNQLVAGKLPPDTTVGTNPFADYWDKSTGFFSIRFGSVGPNRDKSAENSYSYPGIFPCGGKYDDGLGGVVNGESGAKGKAPKRILTYDEFLYIQAELIHIGKLTTAGTAVAKLKQAITASFAKVDQVVAASGTTQVVPTLTGKSAVTTFITKVEAEFNAASKAKQLEIIMTQKWVATFGDPMDQYNDYRRTGYPVLADPKGASPEYQLNNGDGFPLVDSQTVLLGAYQVSLFWPQSELNANTNAPKQKDPTTYKIFWDK